MNPVKTNQQPIRDSDEGWSVAKSGDNGVELLQYTINLDDNLIETAQKAEDIAALVVRYEQSNYVQIVLRGWQITIIMSVPAEARFSEAQQQLAAATNKTYGH